MSGELNDPDLIPGTGTATDLLLNADGFLAFENGDLVLARGIVGSMQEAKLRCRFWRGTWFLDLTEGIDFENFIGVKPADVDGLKNRFRAEIAAVTNVRSVANVDASLSEDRTLRLSYTASYVSDDTTTPISDSFTVQT